MNESKVSAYDVALQELHSVARAMNLSDEIVRFLATPQRMMTVSIPVRMDDGSQTMLTGHRVQHNRALGPTRGGTRFHAEETLDDVKALALWMTIKNSLAGIPSGGGKGGVAVDASKLSAAELERVSRGYIRAIYPMINPDVDVFGPDMGTPPQVMAWFLDEYEVLSQRHVPSAFTGKPILLGGSLGRVASTGYGIMYNAKEFLRQSGQSLEGKTVAIQGFGNLGSYAAEAFTKAGAKVIAATDVHGGIYNAKGIDVAAAMEQVAKKGTIKDLPGCDSFSNKELLACACDILIPAALQNQITQENAADVRAKFVIEGANGPITPAGEEILLDKGVAVMPGIAANCGGVLVSYLEHVQNRYSYYWSEKEVYDRLETTMTQLCTNLCQVAEAKKLTLRTAAWVVSLDKVITAMQLRGWVAR